MAHADAVRVDQSLIHQSQLLFGNGQQWRQSSICQATPHDVRLRSILRRQGTLMALGLVLDTIFMQIKMVRSNFL